MMLYVRHTLMPALLLASSSVIGAETLKLSPEVEAFVRVQAPTVVLAHVRVVDGTGKPAVDDQNVVIEHGQITIPSVRNDPLAIAPM